MRISDIVKNNNARLKVELFKQLDFNLKE